MNKSYEAALGEKKQAYYLARFDKFERKEGGLAASWNWPAFMFTGIWALYRKMYGWFFVFWGLAIVSNLFERAGSSILSSVFFGVFAVIFGIFSNALYHNNIVKKIAKAKDEFPDEGERSGYLQRKGGINTWVIWVFGAIPVAGIIAAILIPMLADN